MLRKIKIFIFLVLIVQPNFSVAQYNKPANDNKNVGLHLRSARAVTYAYTDSGCVSILDSPKIDTVSNAEILNDVKKRNPIFNIQTIDTTQNKLLTPTSLPANVRPGKYQPKEYQRKSGNIILGGTREKIPFFVKSATEGKTLFFDLDSVSYWIDSLVAKNIAVTNNAKPSAPIFCFDGPMYVRVRMEYGDTLRLVYNANEKKNNVGLSLGTARVNTHPWQFYDDKGKPISTAEYQKLQKRKKNWFKKFI